MIDRKPSATVITAETRLDLKARMDALDTQRICLRITDKHWAIMKERARKSPKPLVEALQSELDRCAAAIQDHYGRFILRKS